MRERSDLHWLLDLCGRIVMTHKLDPALLVAALGVTNEDADAIIAGVAARREIDPDMAERLPLILNILIRIELRFAGDSAAMRHALATPLDALGGAAPIDLIGGGVKALQRIRGAVDHMPRPRERWWRIGH